MDRYTAMIEQATEVIYLEISLVQAAVKELEQVLQQYYHIPKLRLPAPRKYSWGRIEMKFVGSTAVIIELIFYRGNMEFTSTINNLSNRKQARHIAEMIETPANIWSAVQALRQTRVWLEKRKQGLLRAVDETLNQQSRFVELLTAEAALVALRGIRE